MTGAKAPFNIVTSNQTSPSLGRVDLEGNEFVSCAFENPINAEAMLWTPMNPNAAIGAIGLSRCRFEDCEFRRIGLTGGPEVVKQLQEIYASVSTKETT